MNVKDPLSPGSYWMRCFVHTRSEFLSRPFTPPLPQNILYIYIYIQSTRIAVEIVATMMGALLHAPDNNCSLSIFVIIHAYYVEEGSETRLLLGRCTKERRWASFPFCQELAAKLKLWPKSGVKRGGRREEWKEEWRERMERSEILRKNLARTLSRTMEYAVYLGNSFSSLLSAFPIFFFLLLSRTSISERLKSVCTFESRDLSFFFFSFWNKREKGGSKDTSGTKGRRILFFLSEGVKDFRARIRQIWGRSYINLT